MAGPMLNLVRERRDAVLRAAATWETYGDWFKLEELLSDLRQLCREEIRSEAPYVAALRRKGYAPATLAYAQAELAGIRAVLREVRDCQEWMQAEWRRWVKEARDLDRVLAQARLLDERDALRRARV